MSDSGKCGHEQCNCPVADAGAYCSDHCREAQDQDISEIKCDCGHSGCD